jgi:outer membrane murein-binding lipoprotein Lpp
VIGVPAFAREQIAAFVAPGPRRADLPHDAQPEHLKACGQEPTERRSRVSERVRRNAVGRVALLVGLALSLSGCATEPRSAIPDVTAEVHELAARIDQLDARRMLAADAAGACRQACLTEPTSLTFRGDRVECRCRPAPNLGVRRMSSRPATARVPEEHGQRLSQPIVNGPGAAVEDAAVAGPARLAASGGSR